MKIIGVVGGMGSGKSTVVHLLSELAKTYIISADHIGHRILKKGNPGYTLAIETFGKEIVGEDGEINRGILGSIVFSDPAKLEQLNQISHPLIYKKVKEEIEVAASKDVYDYIIVDAALLIEIRLIELVNQVWGVYLPFETQVERIMLRNSLSKEEAIKRISTQLPWLEIKKRTDATIDNGGTMGSTKEQIEYLLKQSLKGTVKSEKV